MKAQGCLLIFLVCLMLNGCLGEVWTGANLVYDRHNIYKKTADMSLALKTNNLLFRDRILKQAGCALDLAVFNQDVLVTGHVPYPELKALALERLKNLKGYRKLFIQIAVSDNAASSLNDTWLTTKIRGKILADSSIDPDAFKIITADSIVYIMGDVKLDQGLQVLDLASNTEGVKRVVRLLNYYTLTKRSLIEKPAA